MIANRERYGNVRAFRNALVFVTATLAALIVLLAVWHALDTNLLDLCRHPDGQKHCLNGMSAGRPDVALVAIVGAVGGLMALAFGFTEAETTPTRYDPRIWQTVLKPVAGAATALAGVLLIQADLLTGVVKLHTEASLLSYALVLGFSQQLFTQFVDKRANKLISNE